MIAVTSQAIMATMDSHKSADRIRQRINARMKELGLKQVDVASRAGVLLPTLNRVLKGARGLDPKWVKTIASALDCSVADLLGEDSLLGGITVPVVGYVGAGEKVFNFEDSTPIDYTAPPHGAEDTEAVRVRGDSMFPRYEDGTLLFFYPSTSIAGDCIGRTCVVQVKDGPTLVKKLKRGTMPGRYRLISTRAPEMEDVDLLWAARVLWTKEP